MTGSKELVTELKPNEDQVTVTFGDLSRSKVTGLGKVVVAPDITLVNVMLVESLGYNLLSVCALTKLGISPFFDKHVVVLLWSKSLRVAFVGYMEHEIYVVDFSGATTTQAMCLFGKADVGWLWNLPLARVN